MNVLDTFSGIGAFSQAALASGMRVVAHVEKDKHCQALLNKHYPDIRQLGDIYNVQKDSIGETIDLIAGGSPCQNFSVAGNREGLAGEESQLWYEYLRLVKSLTPQWLVWENVPGVLHSNRGFDFLTILRGLDECGYQLAWRVLDAQYFGVPQRRRRVFIVGHLRDGRAAKVLFERESLPGTSQTRPRTWQSSPVAGTIAASASGTARPAGQANELDFLVFGRQHSHTFTENPQTASTLRARNNRGQSDTDEMIIKNRIIRRFTPLECERLMGFPDFWTEGFSDTARYHMLGNSIAVPVAKWIFERIAAVSNES